MLQHTGSLSQQNKRCLPSIEWEVERVQISWGNKHPTSDQIRLWFWAQRSLCFVMFTFEEKCTSRHEHNIVERRGEKKTENWTLKWVLRVVRVDPIPRLSLDRYRSLSYGWCSVEWSGCLERYNCCQMLLSNAAGEQTTWLNTNIHGRGDV